MIIPTVLTDDLVDLKNKIELLKDQVDRFQIDVIDGRFADNKTVPIEELLGLKQLQGVNLDFHLMVEEPVTYIEKNWPGHTRLLTAHVEAMPSQIEFVRLAKEKGFLAGLAVDWGTALEDLSELALDLTDQVLLLGVKAGHGGQEINPGILLKIKELVAWRQKEGWPFTVGVDGGVDENSLAFCKKMKSDEWYIGSALWEADDPKAKLVELNQLVEQSN